MRSRKIVAWTIRADACNASVILRTFVDAVKENGRPGMIYIDNGDDFDSRTLQGVTKHQRRRGKKPGDLTPEELARVGGAFNMIGCKITHAWIYHGQSKPIERGFGTICSRFSKLWDTYTGKDTASKPETLKKHLATGNVPSLEELTAAFAEWVNIDYNARTHTGDGMNGQTPDQVYAANLASVDRVPEELLEFATFERFGPVKVHKNGVTWKGLSYGWALDELIRRLGQSVMLAIDERTASHVYVLDLEGRLICRAPVAQKIAHGASKETIDAGLKLKRRARKISAEYAVQRPRLTMDAAELSFAAAREKARQNAQQPAPNDPPPSVRHVRTPFDAQANAVQRAVNEPQYRQAAGAETVEVSGSGGFSYANPAREQDAETTMSFTYRTMREDAHE